MAYMEEFHVPVKCCNIQGKIAYLKINVDGLILIKPAQLMNICRPIEHWITN